jgi:hypothetical protein
VPLGKSEVKKYFVYFCPLLTHNLTTMKVLSQIFQPLAIMFRAGYAIATSWLKKRVLKRDQAMVLGLFLVWLYLIVGFCISFVTNTFWLGILFVLIFIPIYHWNLANLGISNNESVLTVLCSLPTVVSISWLICLSKPTLSPIAAVATSLTLVGYSYTTIEVASKYLGKARAVGLVTVISCLGLTLGWFLRDFFPRV